MAYAQTSTGKHLYGLPLASFRVILPHDDPRLVKFRQGSHFKEPLGHGSEPGLWEEKSNVQENCHRLCGV